MIKGLCTENFIIALSSWIILSMGIFYRQLNGDPTKIKLCVQTYYYRMQLLTSLIIEVYVLASRLYM